MHYPEMAGWRLAEVLKATGDQEVRRTQERIRLLNEQHDTECGIKLLDTISQKRVRNLAKKRRLSAEQIHDAMKTVKAR